MQEDGFEFTMVTDSLADALGLKFPRRAMGILSGPNGGGKSLISQRLVFGFIGNGHKVLVITTELTTRGWIEQMDSIGYGMTDALDDGQLLVLSRFGSIAQTDPTVGIEEVLASPAIEHAEIIVIDSASSIIPKHLSAAAQFDLLNKIRGIASDDKLVVERQVELRGAGEVRLHLDRPVDGERAHLPVRVCAGERGQGCGGGYERVVHARGQRGFGTRVGNAVFGTRATH